MMMRIHTQFVFCCASVLLLLPGVSRALDLTPLAGIRQGNEGPPTPVTEFTDGKSKISWRPPSGWLVNGGPTSVSLSAPNGNGAWMKLIVVKKNKQQPEAAAQPATAADVSPSDEEMKTWVMQFIPAGAKNVAFVNTVSSPYVLDGHGSTEFIFTFARYGSRDSISVSVVDYSDTERLVVLISAAEKEFEKARSTAISSLFNWRASK